MCIWSGVEWSVNFVVIVVVVVVVGAGAGACWIMCVRRL